MHLTSVSSHFSHSFSNVYLQLDIIFEAQMPTQHLYLKVSKKPQNYSKLSPEISCNTQNTNIIWPQIIDLFQYFIFQWITPLFLQLDKSGGHPWHPAYLIHLHFPLLLPPTYIYWVPTWKAIVVHSGEFHGSIIDLSWTKLNLCCCKQWHFEIVRGHRII